MTDDEIALKLMRLYKELRSAADPQVRASVCEAIDALVAKLKKTPGQAPIAATSTETGARGDTV